jgi:hypothetical protein
MSARLKITDQAMEAGICGCPLELISQHTNPNTNPKRVVTKSLIPLMSPPALRG